MAVAERVAGPFLIIVTGLVLLATGWGTWPNAQIDFGRELYVPWRLVEGDVLYRDIAYFNGPLSPYVNAVWFELFGTSLRTLVLCNLAITSLLGGLAYALVLRSADRFAATCAGLVFVAVFAFSQLDAIGNDTFLAPYSHEITHGTALGLAAVALLAGSLRTPLAGAAGSGLLLGLVFLTKIEVFLATASALAVGVALVAVAENGGRRRACVLGAFAAAALVPPIAAFSLLASSMPAERALEGVLGSWPAALDPRLRATPFYRATLGTLPLWQNLWALLRWTAGYAAFLVPLSALAVFGRRRGLPSTPMRVAAGALALAVLLYVEPRWLDSLRPLPLFLALAVLASLPALSRALRDRPSPHALLRICLTVFALALLAKIALRVQLVQYGFALALPGGMLLAVALAGCLPRAVEQRGGDGGVVRAGVAGAGVAVLLSLFAIHLHNTGARSTPVGSGSDAFLAGPRGPVIAQTLKALETRLRPRDTLAVIPEGVMLNYLARRENPTGHLNFMPPELIVFGEGEIVAAFEKSPPDWIALAARDTREYGFAAFGRGYGRELLDWLRARYEPVALFGELPLGPHGGFGIRLLERRSGAGTGRASSPLNPSKPWSTAPTAGSPGS